MESTNFTCNSTICLCSTDMLSLTGVTPDEWLWLGWVKPQAFDLLAKSFRGVLESLRIPRACRYISLHCTCTSKVNQGRHNEQAARDTGKILSLLDHGLQFRGPGIQSAPSSRISQRSVGLRVGDKRRQVDVMCHDAYAHLWPRTKQFRLRKHVGCFLRRQDTLSFALFVGCNTVASSCCSSWTCRMPCCDLSHSSA